MSNRGYKVVYQSSQHTDAPSASDSTEDQLSPPRSPRRGGGQKATTRAATATTRARSADAASRREPPPSASLKKTTYEVARERNNEAYVQNANVMVIDSPARTKAARAKKRTDSESTTSEWEIIRPKKKRDGAYVISMGAEHTSHTSSTSSGHVPESDAVEAIDPLGKAQVLLPSRTRDRSLSSGTIEAIKQVHVTEEVSSSSDSASASASAPRPSRHRRGRTRNTALFVQESTESTGVSMSGALAAKRARSALRKDHSPASIRRRRSRSVGFYNKDIRNHDSGERKHELPGTEAKLYGEYLAGRRRGQYARRYAAGAGAGTGAGTDDDEATVMSGSTGIRQRDGYGEDPVDRPSPGSRAGYKYYPRRSTEQSYSRTETEGSYEARPGPRPWPQPGHSRDDGNAYDDDGNAYDDDGNAYDDNGDHDDASEPRYSEYYERKAHRYYR